jgi:hypothetical protein
VSAVIVRLLFEGRARLTEASGLASSLIAELTALLITAVEVCLTAR